MESIHQLSVIMFTDIVGYTAMMEADEEKTVQVLERSVNIQSEIISNYHGRIVKELGDGLLCIFSSAINAVQAAIEIQKSISESELDFKLKIALHSGEVIVKPNDVIGNDVNIGSRLETLAVANSIVISDKILSEIDNKGIETIHLGSFQFKNVTESIDAYSIKSEGLSIPNPYELDIKGKLVWKTGYRSILIILGYLAFGWILLELVKYIQETYYISLVWSDIAGILLVGILPSIIVAAYFSHRRTLTNYFIPSNVIVTLIILIVFSFGKPLGSYANQVEIINYKGAKETFTSIKEPYRIRIGIADFINKNEVDSLNWLIEGLPDLIAIDLEYSDVFFWSYVESSDGIAETLADYIEMDYLLLGSFVKLDDNIKVSLQLYDEFGSTIINDTLVENSLFNLIDGISDEIVKSVENLSDVPPIKNVPISEITSNSYQTIKHYYMRGFENVLQSITYDPEFIMGYQYLGEYMGALGTEVYTEKAIEYYEKGLPFRSKLKQLDQLRYLMNYYMLKDSENALSLAGKIIDLYPNNLYMTWPVLFVLQSKNEYYDQFKRYIIGVYDQLEPTEKLSIMYGMAYQGDKEMIELINKEIEDNPFNTDWPYLKALYLYSKKDLESAREVLEETILIEPEERDSIDTIIRSMENYNLLDLSGEYTWGGHSKRIYKNKYGIPIIVYSSYNNQSPCFILNEEQFFDGYCNNEIVYSEGELEGFKWGIKASKVLMYKKHDAISDCIDDIMKQNYTDAAKKIAPLIEKYQLHNYLLSYEKHIGFVESETPIDSAILGKYDNNVEVYIRGNRVKINDSNGIEFDFLPISPTTFCNPYRLNMKYDFINNADTPDEIRTSYINNNTGTFIPRYVYSKVDN